MNSKHLIQTPKTKNQTKPTKPQKPKPNKKNKMNCDVLARTLCFFSNLEDFENLTRVNKESFNHAKLLPEDSEPSVHKQKLIKRKEILKCVGLMKEEQLRRIFSTRFKHLPHTAKTLEKAKLQEVVIRILLKTI